jgi:hypothetical protein
VLGNFQTDRKVKSAVEFEWLRQVAGQKPIGRNSQLGTVNVIAIDAPAFLVSISASFIPQIR